MKLSMYLHSWAAVRLIDHLVITSLKLGIKHLDLRLCFSCFQTSHNLDYD